MLKRMQDALVARRKEDKGFTLIELLVVVLIIGILAAIAIPVYIGQQNAAYNSAAQSNASNAKTAVVAYVAAFPSKQGTTISSTDLNNYGWPAGATAASLSGTYGGAFLVCFKSQAGGYYWANSTTSVNTDSATACGAQG